MISGVRDWAIDWVIDALGLEETDDPPREWLTPVGDTGFWVTPDTPADPFDCDRYPNSPYCGDFLSPLFGLIRNPLGFGFNFHRSECEICVDINPSLFLIPLPVYSICYRSNRSGCGPGSSPESGSGSSGPPDPYPVGCIRWFEVMVWGPKNPWVPGRDPPPEPMAVLIPAPSPDFSISPHPITNLEIFKAGERPVLTLTTGQETRYRESLYLVRYSSRNRFDEPYTDVLSLGWQPNEYPAPIFVRFYLRENQPESCNPIAIVPPPPPIPLPGNDMCDCQEMTEIMRLIARRLGVQDYPVQVPQFLVRTGNDNQQRLESLTEFVAWLTYQVDALAGEFPIRIDIQDVNPSESGDQTVSVTLPNIAETLAELYGLAAKLSVSSDIHTNFLMRLSSEVVATKVSSLVTQDYARANADFLGYAGNPKRRKVPFSFDLKNLESLEKVMESSVQEIVGWESKSKESILDYLQRLMFAAAIIKAVHYRPGDRVAQEIRDLFGMDGQTDDEWENFIDAVNDPENNFNRDSPTRPRVVDTRPNSDPPQNSGGGSGGGR